METKPSTANAVWIALTTLQKENPDKDAFHTKEIAKKIKDLDIQSASDVTVMIHISSHCRANKPAQPDTHRKIFRVRQGWYRLYVDGDPYHPQRKNGQVAPLPEMIPKKFRYLIDWYNNKFTPKMKKESRESNNMVIELIDDRSKIDEGDIFFVEIQKDNLTRIPNQVLDSFGIAEGDHIAFIVGDNGKITLRGAVAKFEIKDLLGRIA